MEWVFYKISGGSNFPIGGSNFPIGGSNFPIIVLSIYCSIADIPHLFFYLKRNE
jgi:hypothetical protein